MFFSCTSYLFDSAFVFDLLFISELLLQMSQAFNLFETQIRAVDAAQKFGMTNGVCFAVSSIMLANAKLVCKVGNCPRGLGFTLCQLAWDNLINYKFVSGICTTI